MFTATRSDTPTFEEYAAASWPSLYRGAYLLTGNHADAEDVAQQALIKAHGAWSKVIGSDSPNAYVRRILTNTFLSSRRPKVRSLELITDAPPERGHDPGPGSSEMHLVLWPHVKKLPPQQRAVIVLRYYEDLSEAEIADALGCSTGTVKSTAHRALKALRAAIGSDDLTGRED